VTILMRRTALLLALAMVATMAIAGVAYAATIVGTNGGDWGKMGMVGTPSSDTLYGLNGSDYIIGMRGADEIYGGRGRDELQGDFRSPWGDDYIVGGLGQDAIWGYGGDDRIEAADGQKDWIDCGAGEDMVSVDKGLDFLHPGCEIVNGRRR
jgi:Ca2+-binding RTX toxin-like protein